MTERRELPREFNAHHMEKLGDSVKGHHLHQRRCKEGQQAEEIAR
jgi:hypothetical protein